MGMGRVGMGLVGTGRAGRAWGLGPRGTARPGMRLGALAARPRGPWGRHSPVRTGPPCPRMPPQAAPRAYAAARPPLASCQGVKIRGPLAVIATVNSKWAASDPSWE